MPKYRVKPGMHHGTNNRHGPGDEVELTEEEAKGFLDKLELVGEEANFSISAAKVDEVLRAVEDGMISAEAALEAEKDGKGRKSLIDALEEMLAESR